MARVQQSPEVLLSGRCWRSFPDVDLHSGFNRLLSLLKELRGDLFGDVGFAAIRTHLGGYIPEHHDCLTALKGHCRVTSFSLSVLADHTLHDLLLSEKPGFHRSGSGSYTVMTIISS